MTDEQTELDARLNELIEIGERLETCTDPSERQTLRDRQQELRAMTTHDQLEGMPTERLIALERSLASQREEKAGRRIDMGAAGAGGPWNEGFDPVQVMEQNRKTDEASGLGAVEQRLREVRSELAKRTDTI